MKISLIIPTCNRSNEIGHLLSSVEKQSLRPAETIIVDQSDDNKTLNIVEEYKSRKLLPNLSYIHRVEKSSARARNVGLDMAKGDAVSFTDDDIVLSHDYFENISNHFKDPSVGGITGYDIESELPTGLKFALRKFFMRIFLLSNFSGRMTASGFGYPIFNREVFKTQDVELFPGYSMTIRRDFLLKEKFDDWFSGYSYREDVDLSFRLSRLTRLIIAPDVKLKHDAASSNRLNLAAYKKMQFTNYRYVFMKNKYRGSLSMVLFWYSLLGIVLLDFAEYALSLKKEKWDAVLLDLRSLNHIAKEKHV